MDKKITKKTLNEELNKRIKWFENAFKWNKRTKESEVKIDDGYPDMRTVFGKYKTYLEIKQQIKDGTFF